MKNSIGLWFKRIVALSFLLVGFLGANTVHALQGVATQEVNINVLPQPYVPNTGHEIATQPSSDGGTLTYVLLGTSIVSVLLLVCFLTYRRKITKKSLLISIITLSSLAFTFAVFQPTNAATIDPTISLNPDILNYSMMPGESASLNFSAAVTTSPTSTGYTLSAASDNTNQNISLQMTGGDLSSQADLPALDTGDTLLLRNSSTNASNGDTSNFALTVNLSKTITPGTYKIYITYMANTDEGEFFVFSIDTRMTDTLDTDATHYNNTATTFSIPTSGYVSRNSDHAYSWAIDWGDGTPLQFISGTSGENSNGIPHTYATPNAYQITIRSSGPVTSGWLNAFGFYNTTTGANTQTNKNMFKSIDSPLTDSMRTADTTYRFAYMFYGAHNAIGIPPDVFDFIKTASANSTANMFNSTFANYASNSTIAAIPSGLFESIDLTNTTDASDMFNSTFFYFANNSISATIPDDLFSAIDTSTISNISNLFRDTFFNHAVSSTSGTIPATLFSSIRIANNANASNLFAGTFYYYAFNSTSGTIPDALFSSINTTNAVNISGMFSGTFYNYAFASTAGTIPATLFSTINTANITDTSNLFRDTFYYYAFMSNTATIPAGLFSAINTSNATNTSSMFRGTFPGFALNSTSATIPAGLFDSIDTSKATDMSNMFRDTFSNYAPVSTAATIPAGLFDSISTANAANVSGMFSGTFFYYAHISPSASIPANLFNFLNLSNANDIYQMFYHTFDNYAYESVITTDINSIWGNTDFASKITAANADSTLYSTFASMRSLTGSAQTFINSKLGDITPVTRALTFASTAVSDLSTIDANWK